jgi:hypothetical protein
MIASRIEGENLLKQAPGSTVRNPIEVSGYIFKSYQQGELGESF